MTDIFKSSNSKKPVGKQSVLNLNVIRLNQVRYGERNVRVLGPKISNNLPIQEAYARSWKTIYIP